MSYYQQNTVMEIGKLSVSVTEWPNTDDEIAFTWVEDMPAPYTDNEVDITIEKDEAIRLVEILTNHFQLGDE